MKFMRMLIGIGLLTGVPTLGFAADEGEVLLLRAWTSAQDEECDQARGVLSRPETPKTVDGELWLGRCQVARHSYRDALPHLEEAALQGPSRAEAALYLGIARYHLEDRAGAHEALRQARALGATDPQLELYENVLAIDRGEVEDALESLQNMGEEGDEETGAAVSFFEGLAQQRVERRRQAGLAFKRVIQRAPDSEWARLAEKALASVDAAAPRRRWLKLRTGIEYDHNVALRSASSRLPAKIAGDGDARLVWSTELGLELARSSRYRGGVMLGYRGSSHDDVDEFNVDAPSFGGWLDVRLSEDAGMRFRYDFAYKWVGGDSFASSNSLRAGLYRDWGRRGRTELSARGYQYDYRYSLHDVTGPENGGCSTRLCGPAGIDEKRDRNRDGNGLTLGLRHRLPVGRGNIQLMGAYRYDRYFARGDDYAFQAHDLAAGISSLLPFDAKLEAWTGFTYRPFRNRSSYPIPGTVRSGVEYALDGQRRRDQAWRFSLSLKRKLGDRAWVEARYRAFANDSSAEVFDYNRQIFGLYFSVRLQD